MSSNSRVSMPILAVTPPLAVDGRFQPWRGGFSAVENDNWDCDPEASACREVSPVVLLDPGDGTRSQWEDARSGKDIIAEGWFFGSEMGVTSRF